MNFNITNFIRRTMKTTVAAICLAAGLPSGQTAYAIDVSQTGNTLTITGDNSDDYVYIEGATAHDVWVWTTLGIDIYYGVQHLHVDLQGGDNTLAMYEFDLFTSSDVSFTAGDGNDEVWMGQCYVNGSVSIDLGNGNNDVSFDNDDIVGSVTVDGGSGRDRVEMLQMECGSVECVTRGGDDVIGLGDGYSTGVYGFGYVEYDLTVRAGTGRDFVTLVDVSQTNNVYGATLIRMGRQDDILVLSSNDFDGEFTARGLGGVDKLYQFPGNIYDYTPTIQGFEEVH